MGMRYLISFPDGAMTFTAEEAPDVARASHAVLDEARAAGVYVFAGGLDATVAPVLVRADGTVSAETYPRTEGIGGGFMVVDVPSREVALEWAAKVAVACRCAQEVRQFMYDPLV